MRDVCLTPKKKDGKPVPYPVIYGMELSRQCSPNVFFRGKPAYLHNESFVDDLKGDEPGRGKGGRVGGAQGDQPQYRQKYQRLRQRLTDRAHRGSDVDELATTRRGAIGCDGLYADQGGTLALPHGTNSRWEEE